MFLNKKDALEYKEFLQNKKNTYIENIKAEKENIENIKQNLKFYEKNKRKYGDFEYSRLISKSNYLIEESVYNSYYKHSKVLKDLDVSARIDIRYEIKDSFIRYLFDMVFLDDNNKEVVSENITSFTARHDSLDKDFLNEIVLGTANQIARHLEAYCNRGHKDKFIKVELFDILHMEE